MIAKSLRVRARYRVISVGLPDENVAALKNLSDNIEVLSVATFAELRQKRWKRSPSLIVLLLRFGDQDWSRGVAEANRRWPDTFVLCFVEDAAESDCGHRILGKMDSSLVLVGSDRPADMAATVEEVLGPTWTGLAEPHVSEDHNGDLQTNGNPSYPHLELPLRTTLGTVASAPWLRDTRHLNAVGILPAIHRHLNILRPYRAPDIVDESAETPDSRWGRLPELGFVSALGLMVVAAADALGRSASHWGELAFFVGLIVLIAPSTARLLGSAAGREERIGLTVLAGLNLYLVKVFHSPLFFTHHDEIAHWRTTHDIFVSHHLYHANPILPITALYPGMEIVTTALVNLSGLPIFQVGIFLMGVARVLFVVALFLFVERVSGSPKIASLGCLIYFGEPNFLFFDAMFKYETMAFPIALTILNALFLCQQVNPRMRNQLRIVVMLALVALNVTHHVTAYGVTVFLLAWIWVKLVTRRVGERYWMPWGIALVALALNLGWVMFVADQTVGYLAPVFGRAVVSVVDLVGRELGKSGFGSTGARTLFQDRNGHVAPLWERSVGIGSVILVLIDLPFGLLYVWKRHESATLPVLLALSALAYPVMLSFRFTTDGWETANRSAAFLYLGVGFVLAVCTHAWIVRRDRHWPLRLGLAAAISVIFVGGVIAGWPPTWRLPGPYLPVQDTRSIDPQGLTMMRWVPAYLGTKSVVGSDRVDVMLLASYGGQAVTTPENSSVDLSYVLFAGAIGNSEIGELHRSRAHYLVLDERLRQSDYQTKPCCFKIPIQTALAKYDRTPHVSRVYDSGSIKIYDVSGLRYVR